MLKGIYAGDAAFNIQLNRVETRIAENNQQITSGIRVNQAQDDPFAIQSILDFQGQLHQLSQLQTNLNVAKTDTSAADSALATTTDIVNRLIAIGSQGASDITSSISRANLGTEAQQLFDQVSGIVNTQVGGRFIFGGDDPSLPPYTLATTTYAVANTPSTKTIRDGNGAMTRASMAAKEIFDNPSASLLKANADLVTALKANDTAGTQTALSDLKKASAVLTNATVFYGNVQSWIQTANDRADSQIVSLRETIANLRDADVPTAITRMTSDQTSLEAAIAAHASLSKRTLFDYLA